MLTATLQSQDSIQIITNATWKQYQELEADGLISYIDNEIIIVAPGRNHERIADVIRQIIVFYCLYQRIPLFTFGSTRLEKLGVQGKEPDVAYAVGEDKDMPDVAAEVNFTSGSIKDLTKYVALGIPEVWVWQRDELKFYYLDNNNYYQITESKMLPGLTANKVARYCWRYEEDLISLCQEFFQDTN